MTGGIEDLAAQHHRGGDVADFGDAEPGDRLLQRHDGRARAQRRGIRDSHDLAGQGRIGLNQLGELRRIGDFAGGELERAARRRAAEAQWIAARPASPTDGPAQSDCAALITRRPARHSLTYLMHDSPTPGIGRNPRCLSISSAGRPAGCISLRYVKRKRRPDRVPEIDPRSDPPPPRSRWTDARFPGR